MKRLFIIVSILSSVLAPFSLAQAAIQNPVYLVRQSSATFLIYTPIANAGNRRAVWTMQNITGIFTNVTGPNNWRLWGAQVWQPGSANQILSDPAIAGVWEYAYQFATSGSSPGQFNFVGGGHGCESMTGYTLTADGVDETNLAVGATVQAASVVFTQTGNHLLPTPPTCGTSIGSFTLTHTFTSSGLEVKHSHTYDTSGSYWIRTAYSGMVYYSNTYLASNNPITSVTVGTSSPYTITHSNSIPSGMNVKASTTTGYNAALHPYTLTMTLPSGGPDDAGSWARDQSNFMFALDQPTNINYLKAYATWNDQSGVPPATSSHTTDYNVTYSGSSLTQQGLIMTGVTATGLTMY